jgi:hypothetical protein
MFAAQFIMQQAQAKLSAALVSLAPHKLTANITVAKLVRRHDVVKAASPASLSLAASASLITVCLLLLATAVPAAPPLPAAAASASDARIDLGLLPVLSK